MCEIQNNNQLSRLDKKILKKQQDPLNKAERRNQYKIIN